MCSVITVSIPLTACVSVVLEEYRHLCVISVFFHSREVLPGGTALCPYNHLLSRNFVMCSYFPVSLQIGKCVSSENPHVANCMTHVGTKE